MTADNDNPDVQPDSFDWKRLLVRKDRPLPKAGCSVAFYLLLVVLMVYLVLMYCKYKSADTPEPTVDRVEAVR